MEVNGEYKNLCYEITKVIMTTSANNTRIYLERNFNISLTNEEIAANMFGVPLEDFQNGMKNVEEIEVKEKEVVSKKEEKPAASKKEEEAVLDCQFVLTRKTKDKKKGDKCGGVVVNGEPFCKTHLKSGKKKEKEPAKEDEGDTPVVLKETVAIANDEKDTTCVLRAIAQGEFKGFEHYTDYQIEPNNQFIVETLPTGIRLAKFILDKSSKIVRPLTAEEKVVAKESCGCATLVEDVSPPSTPSPSTPSSSVSENENVQEETVPPKIIPIPSSSDSSVPSESEENKPEENKQEDLDKKMKILQQLITNIPGFITLPEEQQMALLSNMMANS